MQTDAEREALLGGGLDGQGADGTLPGTFQEDAAVEAQDDCGVCNTVPCEGITKYCSRCGYTKPAVEFYKAKRGRLKLAGYCKQCVHDYKLDSDYKARRRATDKDKHIRLKAEFLAAYGGKCVCCGETEPDFLTIDHPNDDGEAHRKSIRPDKRRGGSTDEMFRVLRKDGWPSYVRILCFNCNFGRRGRGECAHVRNRLRAV